MYLSKITPLLLCLLVSVSDAQSKSDEIAPAAAATGVEKLAVPFSGKQSEEWMVVQQQMINAKGKVENQKKLIENLIIQKSTLKGSELAEKNEALKTAHIELLRYIENYNTLNSNFETKYPEKGAALGRVYKRIDPTNLQMIEQRMTLEGRLHRLSTKIQKQYPQPTDVVVEEKSKSDKAKLKKKILQSESKSNDIQVTDQIILQK